MISLRDVVTGFGNRDPLTEVWRRNLRGGGGGSAVITGVPPLRYIGDGRPLTDYLISGNAVQDGTPTPEAPVDAVGSGVRTGNLAPPLTEWEDGYVAGNGAISKPTATLLEKVTGLLPVPEGSSQLTFLAEDGEFEHVSSTGWRAIGFYDRDGEFISRPGGTGTNAITVGVPEGAVFMRACCRTYGSDKNYMLNAGSTPLPYEPYGYKLPLTVNGTEYPIYLGTVPTKRRVKKLVLTGEEFVYVYANSEFAFRINTSDAMLNYRYCACTHFPYQRTPGWSTSDGVTAGAGDYNLYFTFSSSSAAQLGIVAGDTNSFKSYLAAQYAAGTPVTVWYVLATSETAVVNEPLMKIGDYADTISAAQAGVTIPTVSGENVLDVPTEVKPSEITIKGGISSV